MASTTQPRNVQAILMGTGQFSFCAGATSLADARAKGFRDFGNIQTVGLKPEVETVEHEGSYEGKKRVDKRWAIKGQIGYGLKCDEITRENLKIVLGGIDASSFTQDALNVADGSEFTFTENAKAVINNWYDIVYASKQVREITQLHIAKAAAESCNVSGSTVSDEGHTLTNGELVILGGTTLPNGASSDVVYYVRDVLASTSFKLAATSGGPAITFGSAGTAVTYRKVIDPATFVVDGKLGRVRYLTEQSESLTPVIKAGAITTGQTASLLGITPLENLIQSGYGRLVIYDETHPNKVVYDHEGFSCQVSFSAAKEFDGKSPVDVDFDVLVTDEVGTVWSAE